MARKKFEAGEWAKHIHNTRDIDTFNYSAQNASEKFQIVCQKIPWIEPSINMLHLDAIRSYVFGSSLSAISTITLLLEHTLRMALWDQENSGVSRIAPSRKFLNKRFIDLLDLIEEPENKNLIPQASDLKWWSDVRKVARNKIAHFDISNILEISKALNFEDHYDLSGIDDPNHPHYWGMFWHRYGNKFAGEFIKQSTEQINKIINATKWKSDESWWISQKYEYDMFFSQDWSVEGLKASLNKV